MLKNCLTYESAIKFILAFLFAFCTLPTCDAMKEIQPKENMLAEIQDPTFNALDPEVYGETFALEKLMSYYKIWYRIARVIFRKKSKVCLLEEEPRKRLCARIFISLVHNLKGAKLIHVLAYMQTSPTPCHKEEIRTPQKGRKIWKSRKSMIFCPPFYYPWLIPGLGLTINPVPGIYVSAAKKRNAVFVFLRNPKTAYLEIFRYIENLTFEQDDVAESAEVRRT